MEHERRALDIFTRFSFFTLRSRLTDTDADAPGGFRHGQTNLRMRRSASYSRGPASRAVQLGSKPAKEWIESLERPERLAKLKADEVLARLELKPGDLVADIGGRQRRLQLAHGARRVAPGGSLYAVEVDPGFIDPSCGTEPGRGLWRTSSRCWASSLIPSYRSGIWISPSFHNVLHHVKGRQAYLKTALRVPEAGCPGRRHRPDRWTQRTRDADEPGPGQRVDDGHRFRDDERITLSSRTGSSPSSPGAEEIKLK